MSLYPLHSKILRHVSQNPETSYVMSLKREFKEEYSYDRIRRDVEYLVKLGLLVRIRKWSTNFLQITEEGVRVLQEVTT